MEMFVMKDKTMKKLLMTSSNILVSRQRWDKTKRFISALNTIEGDVAFIETADGWVRCMLSDLNQDITTAVVYTEPAVVLDLI
jgi:hypothetical protein